jgi:carboxypeptidase C (cathepsin A)
MKRFWGFAALAVVLIFACVPGAAQGPEGETKKEPEAKPATEATPPPKEESSVTDHSIRMGSETIPYKAAAGTILLKDDEGKPNASLFYIAYTRSDVKDLSQRPLAFLYNGGPGSSSVWIQMGAFGPRRVDTANAEPTPPPPYRVVDNANSLIELADNGASLSEAEKADVTKQVARFTGLGEEYVRKADLRVAGFIQSNSAH